MIETDGSRNVAVLYFNQMDVRLQKKYNRRERNGKRMLYGMLEFKDPERDASRKIIHIDMDAFFASVEIRENPSLQGKPVIIGRHPKETGGKGVVATASYEARKYGVHSAMSSMEAYERCPQGIFISGRYDLYREISAGIREVFLAYTDLVEPLSLDEAYLDVTENKAGMKSATLLARKIQREIWEKTRLTCSAGVSYNKFLAKIASDYQKPAGLTTITPGEAENFLKALPIEKFYGVGSKTVGKMHDMNIFIGQDLLNKSETELIDTFGRTGYSLYYKVRGIDLSPVQPNRDRKSIGKENTYNTLLRTDEEVSIQLRELAEKTSHSLERHKKHGKTIVLKVRYDNFETITRRKTLLRYIHEPTDLFNDAVNLWEEIGFNERGIRLLGITMTNLEPLHYIPIELPLWKENDRSH